jgi:hypothetical protein
MAPKIIFREQFTVKAQRPILGGGGVGRAQKVVFGKFRDRCRTEIGIEIRAKTKQLKTAKVRGSAYACIVLII